MTFPSSLCYNTFMPESQAYKPGDIIGQKYEVFGVVGKGGFGVVYLVYSHETESVYALKTFRDEYLEDPEAKALFRKEAKVWVDLERHPYLVRAYLVDEISDRLYVAMEYITPDEGCPNTLQGYLDRRPPDLAQSLRWAIQFCHGMEYAYSKGVRCHRDIKPSNIMISQDKTVKITDFGLASVLGASKSVSGIRLNIQDGRVGLTMNTIAGRGLGTPTYMPPEQFTDVASCDHRSDIYAFGVVLFQMANEGKLPFLASLPKENSPAGQMRFWQEMYKLHDKARVPKLRSPLFPIIHRCLEKKPERRYPSFSELRSDLEPLLKQRTGEVVRVPERKELEAWEWNDKGCSLGRLGRHQEAIRCCDKAIDLNPRSAAAWCNKGASLRKLGRYEEAIQCYDKAIELNNQYAKAWNNKGYSFHILGRYEEAIQCFDKAIGLDPRYPIRWNNKGNSLEMLGRIDEAIQCFDKAIKLDPLDAAAWINKGATLDKVGRHDEAIQCHDRTIELVPYAADAWNNKGVSLLMVGRFEEATRCYDKAIALDPQSVVAWENKGDLLVKKDRFDEAILCFEHVIELDPCYAKAWYAKGNCYIMSGRFVEAIQCYDKVIEFDSRNAQAWQNKGVSLLKLDHYDEGIQCFEKAIVLNPKNAEVWFYKALIEEALARNQDAVHSYKQFLALAPGQYNASQIAHARQRLRELEGKV